ncbi:MAG: putative lipid II flippase FtsW [Candidatus Wildermuthbacteria bacterium]|nr:putative lipid II flippase FtsW [Candidatus Wildermuthbacteria bacterium]
MEKRKRPDPWLLGISCALVILGILILASVSASFSVEKTGNSFYFLSHQLIFGLLPGIALGAVAYFFPLKKLRQISLPLLIVSIVTLALVFIPFLGGPLKGAHRWIYLGQFSVQPSEFLKVAFIVYLAAWLSSRFYEKKIKKNVFLPFLAMLGVIGFLLIAQPDVSTLGVISITGVLMYFLSGTPLLHTILLLSGGASLLFALIHIAPYRFNRLLVFLNPDIDPLGKGYQIKQALIGIGSGGITGLGLGLSFQKFGTLPEPISDSVFAIFAEEAGFIGSLILLALFLLFFWRSFAVALRVDDSFSRLCAMGIACWITFQALFNIGSMTGLLPLAGIPLPFISYGGSALVAELIGIGLLLNISKQAS